MRRAFVAGLIVAGAAILSGEQPAVQPKPYFTEPALSPDRSEIAFVSGGDIWTVPATGGEARLLVSHQADERRPLYSPDGKSLAFTSNRTGGGDIYVLTFATGELRRLTWDDGQEMLDGWSRDGRWLYFTSSSRDIAGMNDVLRVSAGGGTPMEVAADRYTNEYFSAPSPDGASLAITARANASSQWWRKGHSHLDEAEIWIVKEGQPPRYEAVTGGGAKEMWPMWAADGKSLFYVSDRSGVQNLWSVTPGGAGAPRPVTKFESGRVLWPSISADGRQIVFEHDFEIWSADTASGRTTRVDITRRGAAAGSGVQHVTLGDTVAEMALSPDGRKVAFVVRGEVFAASSRDGGDGARISRTAESESQIVWSPDSRRIVYVSDRDLVPQLYLYDFGAAVETRLTEGRVADHSPRFSPDGKLVAFVRGDSQLCVIDVNTRQERVVARGSFDKPPFAVAPPFAWAPDNRWLAYLTTGDRGFTNVYVAPADGGEAKPVSYLANAFAGSVSWSPDGRAIYFDTGQRTEQRQIARVDLLPRTPRFREDQFRDLFREQPVRPVPAPPPPAADAGGSDATDTATRQNGRNVEIVFDGIRQRIALLATGVDAASQTVSPDGKTLLLVARAAGQQNLYTFDIDDLSRSTPVARQLTSTAGGKRSAQFTPDGREVFYLDQGRITAVTLQNRQTRRLNVSAEMDVDFAREKMAVFNQAWTFLHDNFHDPLFNGVDWSGVRDRYAPLVGGSATRDEMRRLLSLMVGELNASHSGVSAPGGTAPSAGKLGVRFDRGEYEQRGHLRITEVIALGPAAIAGIKPGEYITAVDGSAVGPGFNLDEALGFKIDRRVEVRVADGPAAPPRVVALRPSNQSTEKNLLYRQWVEANRAYVDKASGGRLGYVHMYDMSDGALSQLHLDLDVENQTRAGVVIDVRNNNGGFVNMYALDVFSRRNYLTMTPRGAPAAPGRSLLGQRALGAPTVLVTNQHSLSDAEDFTEGYRALQLGKVIGEPTAGWIIYTSNVPLIDGTVVRIPFMRVEDASGQAMEQRPRPVDVPVKRPVGESYTGRDAQLDAAVRELLQTAGPAPGRQGSAR